MKWITTFPYKLQVAEIVIGLSTISCGVIFLLISVGVTSPLWIIMAGTSMCIGALCTVTGAIWCWCSTRRSRSDHDLYGRVRECEVETLTSEATEMIR